MKYYIKFSKQGYIKYTSHLDMLSIFERAFKRAGLSLKYSEGYHPHPKIVFAQPLSLGYSSLCEIMDFELKEDLDEKKVMSMLHDALPDGLNIESIGRKGEGKSFAARLESTIYLIEFPDGLRPSQEALNSFFNQEEILVEKKRKKRKRRRHAGPATMKVDIRPLILDWEYILPDDDNAQLRVKVMTSITGSLNPALLMKALTDFLEVDYGLEDYEIEREDMFFSEQ